VHERPMIRVEAVSGEVAALLTDLQRVELPALGPPDQPPETSRGPLRGSAVPPPDVAHAEALHPSAEAAEPAVPSADAARDPGRGTVVVVAVRPGQGETTPLVDPPDAQLVADWGVDLARRLVRARAAGARSEITWVDLELDDPVAALALGVGAGTPTDVRRSAAAAARRLRGHDRVLVLATREMDTDQLRAFTEGLLLAASTITWATKASPAPPRLVRLVVADVPRARAAIGRGLVAATATLRARQLIHTPSNIKDPTWMERQSGELAAEAGLDVRVWGPAELARDGFGGILAVGAGSARPPRLVRLGVGRQGRRARERRHVVLVGKGITFDSGGLSLKPPEAQVPMKTDMAGAAAVCATLAALGEGCPDDLRVTGLLALAENLPGAGATRPGDVIVHHGGLRTEVRNTDAEGRLVLADALDYAVRDLRADVVVDVATLTGAATLGLGRRHAALFSTSETLAAALVAAGSAAGEAAWQMPLHEGYAERIASEVADQANADVVRGSGPGAITAALFLRRFVAETPWAHLDIAGVGRSDAEKDDLPKGGTGFGARLLLRWIEAGAPC
jgi:leucyl aminopeptidase